MVTTITFELVEEPCEELTLSENAVFSLPWWWEQSAPVGAQEGQEDPGNG